MDYLVSFIVTLASLIALIYVFKVLTKRTLVIDKKLVIIVLISSLVESILGRVLSSALNAVFSILYMIFIFKYIFKISNKESLFYVLFFWLLLVLIDVSLMFVINVIQDIFQIHFEPIIIKVSCTLVLGIILYFLARFMVLNKLFDKVYCNFHKINYSYLQLFLILVLYFVIGAIGIVNLNNQFLIFTLLSLAILFTMTIIKFMLDSYEIINLKEMNRNLLKNNEFYVILINDYRVLKHNLINQLLGIKSLANKKSKLLIDDLIEEYNANFVNTQDIKDAPHGLNGLIYEKLYNFNKMDLKFLVNNNIKSALLDVITPRSYNLLCEAIGILLDNAMEAAYLSEDKVVYLNFKESKENIYIEIMNTFRGDLDVDKLGTKDYTTKKLGSGLGLYSLIGRSKLQVKTMIRNDMFITKITVLKK